MAGRRAQAATQAGDGAGMRILNEKTLSLLWSWGRSDSEDLSRRFDGNLQELLEVARARSESGRPLPPEDLDRLADELHSAGDQLLACAQNALAAAAEAYVLAGGTAAERNRRRQHLEAMRAAIGQTVILRRTSVKELRNKPLLLVDIRGARGVLQDGDSRWEASLDRLQVIERPTLRNRRRDAAG